MDLDASAAPAEALTVIKDPDWYRSTQPRGTDDTYRSAERDFESAKTVLIEPDWDITDINQGQALARERRKRYPIVVAVALLSLAAALIWYIPRESSTRAALQDTSAMPPTINQAANDTVEQAVDNGSEAATGTQAATGRPVDTGTQATTASTATEAATGTQTDTGTEAVAGAETDTGAEPVKPDAEQDIDNGAEESASAGATPDTLADDRKSSPVQGSEVLALTIPDSTEAQINARQAVDRAVQLAEARRQMQLEEQRQHAEIAEQAREAARLARYREAEEAREAASRASSELAATQNAVRPVISDADISTVLHQFNALSGAIRALDGTALREITVPSERKNAYFDYVFRTFDTVEVGVSNINASRQDQTVRGTLTLKRLIRSNGDIAIPPEEFKNIPIYSVKESQWSAIHW